MHLHFARRLRTNTRRNDTVEEDIQASGLYPDWANSVCCLRNAVKTLFFLFPIGVTFIGTDYTVK